MRNATALHRETQNIAFAGQDIQQDIEHDNFAIHYPLIDRLNSTLYERFAEEEFKEYIKSPMTNDNVYVKNLILRNIVKVKEINSDVYEYVLQKAALDANFVVRKVYSEISVLMVKSSAIANKCSN